MLATPGQSPAWLSSVWLWLLAFLWELGGFAGHLHFFTALWLLLVVRRRLRSMPYSQFDNLNLRFLRGGSGRSSTGQILTMPVVMKMKCSDSISIKAGSGRSDFMVTETRAGGENVETQGAQFSEWTGWRWSPRRAPWQDLSEKISGSGEGAAGQVQQPRFSQWTGVLCLLTKTRFQLILPVPDQNPPKFKVVIDW